MNPIPNQEDARLRDYQIECARTNRMLCAASVVLLAVAAMGAHMAWLLLS
ncbi:MAG: hypothetical protein KJZ84_12075 [Bryobacteraceae bacterium]|nr:hypothetical protein [Bryobacteraceae bacterium]